MTWVAYTRSNPWPPTTISAALGRLDDLIAADAPPGSFPAVRHLEWIDCEIFNVACSFVVTPERRLAVVAGMGAGARTPPAFRPAQHGGCDPRRATAAGGAAGRISWRSACPPLSMASIQLLTTPPCHASGPAVACPAPHRGKVPGVLDGQRALADEPERLRAAPGSRARPPYGGRPSH